MISIIIPTLNEEENIKESIKMAISRSSTAIEIIVVDSGSDDGTLNELSSLAVKTIVTPEYKHSKYKSLNRGIEEAKGSILLFLDADTHLPIGFDQAIIHVLSNQEVVGGAFDYSFSSNKWEFKWLAWINRIRMRVENIYYGDQALFCSKVAAEKVDGYPSSDLMEAALFCKRLKKIGKLKLIKKRIMTSPRRFESHGLLNVLLFDFRMWLLFSLGISVSRFGKNYWDN